MKWMLGVVLALGLTGCSWQDDVKVRGEGAVVEQQHPLGHEVTRVLAGVPANLYLVAGESHTLRVKGEANLLPYLVLTEKGEKLEIEVKDGYRLDPTQPLEITITLPTLHELALTGVGNGALRDFKGDDLVLSLAGTGDIVASELTLDRLEGNIAGLGNLDLGQGSARVMALNIAGAGGVKGAGLASEEVEVSIAGSGEVEVRARSRLKIEIAGAGAVNYWGSPALTSEIAGSGQVSRLGS